MGSYENLKISTQKLKMFKNITTGYSTLRVLNDLTQGLRNLIKILVRTKNIFDK